MDLKVNEKIHGFVVTRIREVKDSEATMIEMEHEKTGAQLVYLNRGIENKTFSIAFKTTPKNDTGVFHILEHSVLNGSKRYPVREPFVDLLKGSMQTFLNAMTYPDKTMYPVASRNKKDFFNLVSVYMDAVFAPAIYTNPNIFYQEGWRYEIRKEEEEPKYNGVVFNEMKGAYSSVDDVMVNEINRMLFDNTYQYSSGGDPVHIPELTYEEFIETHKTYYHPSNARIFFDGEIDLDEILGLIDEEYFSHMEKEEMNFSIPMQEAKPKEEKVVEYEVNPGDPLENRTQIAFASIYSRFDEVEKNIAMQALSTYLTGTNEAPFKKAIIEKGLAENIEVYGMDGIQQPFYVIVLQNTEAEKKEEIIRTLNEVVRDLVEKGLDHNKLKANLNYMEFRYREEYEPSGVMNADDALKSWLYDGDPMLYLNCGDCFDALRQKTEDNYFESLLQEQFSNLENKMTLIVKPSDTLGEKRVAEEAKKLEAAKQAWGDQIKEYITLNEKLDIWQQTPDTQEALDTLPRLDLSDVEPLPSKFEAEVKEVKRVPVLVYPEVNPGITYLNAYLSLAGIKLEELPALDLYVSLLKELPTQKKSVEELREEIRGQLGSLSFSTTSVSASNRTDKAVAYLAITSSALDENVSKAVDLILEILQETQFEKEAVRRLVAQYVDENRKVLISSGHSVAMKYCSAMVSASGAASECLSGFTSMRWLDDFYNHFDERIDGLLEQFALFQTVLNNRNRLTLSVTKEENLKEVERLISGMENEAFERCVVHYPIKDKKNVGIVIPAAISYTATVQDLNQFGSAYQGAYRVLAHILTYDYLWNEVRVKGGAYGVGFTTNLNGTVGSYSYRDPNPTNTLQVQKNIGKHMKEWLKENTDLTTYIIGAISSSDPLLPPSSKVGMADVRYLSGIDYDTRKRNREEMLEASSEEIAALAEVLEKALEEAPTCVVSVEDTLKAVGVEEENIYKL